MRTFGRLLAIGAAGFVGWKVIAGVLVPLAGMTMGFLATAIRIAIILAVIYFVLSLFRGRKREAED